jgi:hypothetical protein
MIKNSKWLVVPRWFMTIFGVLSGKLKNAGIYLY